MVRKKHGMARYIRAQSMVWFGAHAAHHMGDSFDPAAHQLLSRLRAARHGGGAISFLLIF